MKCPALLPILALILDTGLARKSYLVKQEHFKKVPRVMALEPNCEICGLQNESDEICMLYEFMWNLGWDWKQDANDDAYTLRLEILSEQSWHFRPFINIPRFIFNQYDFQVDQFNVKYNFEMKVYHPYPGTGEGVKMCVNMFLNIDELPILLQYSFKLQECYTILVNCLWDWSQFTGYDATFFAGCVESGSENIVIFGLEIPAYSLYQLGASSEFLQRAGYNCKPQLDIVSWLPTNPISSKLVLNAMSYMGGGKYNGNLIDIKERSSDRSSNKVVRTAKKSAGQDHSFNLW